MAEKEYDRALNDWHHELHMTADLTQHIFEQLVDQPNIPEWLTSAARIASDRLSQHVETLPFPPAGWSK